MGGQVKEPRRAQDLGGSAVGDERDGRRKRSHASGHFAEVRSSIPTCLDKAGPHTKTNANTRTSEAASLVRQRTISNARARSQRL
eukprot:381250-Rhodomonas_salina.3